MREKARQTLTPDELADLRSFERIQREAIKRIRELNGIAYSRWEALLKGKKGNQPTRG